MRTLFVARCGVAACFALVAFAPHVARANDVYTVSGIIGSAHTPTGAPVENATITASGPAGHGGAMTDAQGNFRIGVGPGTYTITATKAGYATVSTPGVVVTAGAITSLTVTLGQPNLTSLRTIGSVSTTGHGSAVINTGAATETYTAREQFTELASPTINDVVQQIPDVVVEKLGTQADTSIVVGGLQPYETQVLIDGHPIALGQYGVWLSQYFPSYVVGGLETQSGPGNTTPFANIAVGGTANFQTIGFTKQSTFELTQGVDNYSSQYTTAVLTGSTGKFDYVIAGGTEGANGPYYGKRECDVYESNYAANTPQSEGIVAFCGDFSGSLWTRAQLYKARYNFSAVTSLDLGYLGSYGGFSPQGSAWGASYGPTKIVGCLAGTEQCTNPADANLIGQTINGFYWFPGTNIVNQQQLYDAQFRTTFAGTTLLARPYLGNIEPETYVGNGEGGYPAFFAPGSNYGACTGTMPVQPCYAGPPTSGTVGGLTSPNYFESTACPPGNVYSYNQINSPGNTIKSVDGQEECFQYPYSTYEQDKLYGSTFSLVRPVENGNGTLNLTYDFHGQSTFAYANAPSNYQVPMGSATRYSTFSLTGKLAPLPKLGVDFGLYNTDWTVVGQKPVISNGSVVGSTGLERTIGRFDPHVALTYRSNPETSFRAAFGTSETFPFVGDVTGPAAVQPPAFLYSAGIVTEKNPNLLPEYSEEYDLGVDHKFRNGAVLSADLQDDTVHDVFQQLTTQENTTLNGAPAILGIFTPINVARLRAQLVTLRYVNAPFRGFGWNVSATADSSILSGIPVTAYNSSPSLPANDVQVCGNAQFTPGLATCIPYLKGYAEFNYTLKTGTFIALGTDYEGKNNQYYQPPFAILDFRYREPFTKNLDFNASVENLLNTNSYDYLPAPNVGVPAVGDATSANGKQIVQTSYSTYRIPAATRTLRASLRYHFGR